ncbi:MAG: VTT domain-containing protein [Bacteroidota bacterium]|nr:VTT domain-containing protein [Bacteroidota bacterium]
MIQVGIPINLNNIFSIFDAESLVRYGGLLVVCLVVYGTTGLFFCFFLPSGAVLFAAGVFTATGDLHNTLVTVCSSVILASVLGNITGYWFGREAGPLLYKRKDSRFFRQQHLKTADAFYAKYGWLALTAGLFLPIIRTFAPVIAGIIRLNFRRFILLTFTGSLVWVSAFVLAGYFIGSRPLLKPWLKYIVIAFILVVTLPLIISVVRELRKLSKGTRDNK